VPFLAAALAAWAGVGDNLALAAALRASGRLGKAPEDALVDAAYLSAAVAVGASAGLAARLAARALACLAVLGARYGYLLLAA